MLKKSSVSIHIFCCLGCHKLNPTSVEPAKIQEPQQNGGFSFIRSRKIKNIKADNANFLVLIFYSYKMKTIYNITILTVVEEMYKKTIQKEAIYQRGGRLGATDIKIKRSKKKITFMQSFISQNNIIMIMI